MNIKDLIEQSYNNSKDHGFHDGEDKMDPVYVAGLKLALIHSEVSEALECVRSGEMETYWSGGYTDEDGVSYPNTKPEGYLSELADVIIRVCDEVGRLNAASEFTEVITAKMAHNRARPHKHGRKC